MGHRFAVHSLTSVRHEVGCRNSGQKLVPMYQWEVLLCDRLPAATAAVMADPESLGLGSG
jgi:hypothetical protein